MAIGCGYAAEMTQSINPQNVFCLLQTDAFVSHNLECSSQLEPASSIWLLLYTIHLPQSGIITHSIHSAQAFNPFQSIQSNPAKSWALFPQLADAMRRQSSLQSDFTETGKMQLWAKGEICSQIGIFSCTFYANTFHVLLEYYSKTLKRNTPTIYRSNASLSEPSMLSLGTCRYLSILTSRDEEFHRISFANASWRTHCLSSSSFSSWSSSIIVISPFCQGTACCSCAKRSWAKASEWRASWRLLETY